MAKFKQACFAHDLSKKFQIFAAVHNSTFVLNLRHSPLYRYFCNFLCYSISDKIISGVIPIKIIAEIL